MGDTEIFTGIVAFLILTAAITTVVQQEFRASVTENDPQGALEGTQQEFASTTDTNFLSALRFFGTIFAWSFGLIPAWLDLIIYLPMRIVGYYLLIRLIRGV